MPNLFKKDDDDGDDDGEGPQSLRQDRHRKQSNPGRSPRRPRGKGSDPKTAARTLLHERHPNTRKSNN
jgi:hypothetical protein